jgi:hypothetical protein
LAAGCGITLKYWTFHNKQQTFWIIFAILLSSGASGSIQTLYLRIMSLVLYHCTTGCAHSSLFCLSVSDEEKSVLKLGRGDAHDP